MPPMHSSEEMDWQVHAPWMPFTRTYCVSVCVCTYVHVRRFPPLEGHLSHAILSCWRSCCRRRHRQVNAEPLHQARN